MWQAVAAASLVLALGCGRLRFEAGADAAVVSDAGGDAAVQTDGQPQNRAPVLHVDFEGGDPLGDKARSHMTRCEPACPQTVSGAPRGSVAGTFENAPGCVHVTDRPDLRSPSFTYAIWFRPFTDVTQTVLSRPYESETGQRNTFELAVDPDPAPGMAAVGTWIYGTKHTRSLTLGAWHHAAGSYDGQTMRVHYDGVLVFASLVAPLPLPLTQNEPLIGCDRDTGVDYAFFRGEVDDVRIYSIALSDAEIAELAAP